MKRRERKSKRDPESIRERFAEVFDENYDTIYRYLRRRVNAELAADLTAQTFLIALSEFEKFDSARGSVRAWLFGIASNTMKREARRESREFRAYARTGVDRLIEDPLAEVDRRLDARNQQRNLAGGLASLSAKDRESLLLLSWGELNYPEIAEALGVPIGTVKSRIARSRRHLRAYLGETDSPVPQILNEEATNG